MKLLLDTHVWLWWQLAPKRLSKQTHDTIAKPENEVFLSVVSTWEMAIKINAGKLQLPKPLPELVPESLVADDFRALPIQNQHCFELLTLPMHHRDPFDRLLIAQARADRLTVVTNDGQFGKYGVEILDT